MLGCGSSTDYSYIDAMSADEMARQLADDSVQPDEAHKELDAASTRSVQTEHALTLLEKGRLEVVDAAIGKLDRQTKQALVEDFFNPGKPSNPWLGSKGLDNAEQTRLFERIGLVNADNAFSFYQVLDHAGGRKQEAVVLAVAQRGTLANRVELIGRIARGAPGAPPLDQRPHDVVNISGLLLDLARKQEASGYTTAMANITDDELVQMVRVGLTMSSTSWFKAMPAQEQNTYRLMFHDSLDYGTKMDSALLDRLVNATRKAIESLR